MAKVLRGVLLTAEAPRLARGEITFARVVHQGDDGKISTWKNLSMAREVADALRIGQPATLYIAPFMGNLFGVRTASAAVFKADSANPLFLVVTVGMIFLGLGTSMFVFPLLIALAGVAGVILYVQAAGAKTRFRRDGRADAVKETRHARGGA